MHRVISQSRPRTLPAQLALAGLSGVAVWAAFPPLDLWWLAPAGVAALLLLLGAGELRARRGAALGLAHGLGLFVPLLAWLQVIGDDAWLLVALLEGGFFAAFGALVPVLRRLRGWPWWVAGLWVAQEAARDRLPFGGFPWGRLAFAETASPFTAYAALGGAPLVSFATALLAALVAQAVLTRRYAPAVAALVVPLLGLGLAVAPAPSGDRQVRVAVVQGGVPGAGLDFLGEREQVLRNHAAATHRLAARVRAGKVPQPDLVIWPENSSDIDPFRNVGARAVIDAAARDIGVPVLVGAVLRGPGRFVSNTGIVWDPGTGPGQRYVKQHPVPFGEYIPFRPVLSRWIKRLDQIPRDFFAADRPGNLRLGPARIGDVICFEIAYDGLVREVVRGGAQVLVVQTNNATYNGTDQPFQQMAMSRLRAVEHGRPVLVASTSGISAVVAADGSVRAQVPERVARTIVTTIRLRDGQTLASRLGSLPEWLLAGLGLAGLGLAAVKRGRRTRSEP